MVKIQVVHAQNYRNHEKTNWSLIKEMIGVYTVQQNIWGRGSLEQIGIIEAMKIHLLLRVLQLGVASNALKH